MLALPRKCCRGLNHYQPYGRMVRIELQYRMPQMDLKMILVPLQASLTDVEEPPSLVAIAPTARYPDLAGVGKPH